ncbi:MAG: SRPBCC domain-containing protein [Anaerolineae bacterium]
MDIVHELIIRTTRDKVYQALTEPEQIAAWYAPDVQADPVVGSTAEFRFERGVIRVQITVLEPNRTVRWKVLEGLRGWEGATGDITWRLADNPYGAGTMLHYTHSGWQSMTGPYPSTNFRSGWYIARLQTYVESGVLRPA